jgi:hypothetical protein
MSETSTIKCKNCGETCVRILAGKYPNGKDKKWVDEDGREFSGLTCSQCVVDKARARKQDKKKNGYV